MSGENAQDQFEERDGKKIVLIKHI